MSLVTSTEATQKISEVQDCDNEPTDVNESL